MTCVLDTDALIAVLDRRDAHHKQAAHAVETMTNARVPLVISMINYAEALVRPAASEDTLRTAVKAIADFGVRPLTPDATTARQAARHKSASGVSLADGFALATAESISGSVATFDRRVRRTMVEIGLELPRSLQSDG